MTAILVSMTTYRKHNGQMSSMCKDINIGRPRANFLLKIFEETQETADVTQNIKGGVWWGNGKVHTPLHHCERKQKYGKEKLFERKAN